MINIEEALKPKNVLAFLKSKPENEKYCFEDIDNCALAQYLKSFDDCNDDNLIVLLYKVEHNGIRFEIPASVNYALIENDTFGGAATDLSYMLNVK